MPSYVPGMTINTIDRVVSTNNNLQGRVYVPRPGAPKTHLSEPARALDHDALLLARLLVLRAHMQDAVGIDVERNLDLGHTPTTRMRQTKAQHSFG